MIGWHDSTARVYERAAETDYASKARRGSEGIGWYVGTALLGLYGALFALLFLAAVVSAVIG
jgi:hypothetical protein